MYIRVLALSHGQGTEGDSSKMKSWDHIIIKDEDLMCGIYKERI